MNERFKMVLADLSKLIGTELTIEDGISSLTIDGKEVVHLAPIDTEQLAIFMEAGALKNDQQATLLLRQNFFSIEPSQPRVGLSENNHLIIWSQLRTNELDGPAISQALETLLAFYKSLVLDDVAPSNSTTLPSGMMV